MDRRREKWQRFETLRLIDLEIADDLDEVEATRASDRAELARLKGIMFGILISTSTGSILLALNLIAGRT